MNRLSEVRPGNRFLAALPEGVSERLASQLKSIPLPLGTLLAHAGTVADTVYFPDRGLVSLVKIMEDGRTAAVGYIGCDGMVGVAALLGIKQAAFETLVELEGEARAIPAPILRAEMQKNSALKELVLRYIYYSQNRLAQTSACNRLHTLQQRCCRWLLVAHDNAGTSAVTLTLDFLALMMGVNRPSLSLTVAALQRQKLIQHKRGSFTITHREGLEEHACECYRTLRKERDNVYGQ